MKVYKGQALVSLVQDVTGKLTALFTKLPAGGRNILRDHSQEAKPGAFGKGNL